MRTHTTLAAIALLALDMSAAAQTASNRMYVCTDRAGHFQTRDNQFPVCDGVQTVRTAGGVTIVVPPALSPAETDAQEEAKRAAAEHAAAMRQAERADLQLLRRYPNEATHRKDRDAALEAVRASIRRSDARLSVLAAEREPLSSEAEFYVGKPLPFKLKNAIDANDAAADAQKQAIQNVQLRIAGIDSSFDLTLERLRKLWAGTPPGTMGLLANAASTKELK